MKIEITGTAKTKTGTSKAGNDYSITTQQAWLHNGDKYPTAMVVQVESEREAYAVGIYDLPFDKDNFYVDKYGSIAVSRNLKLTPSRLDEKPKVVNG